MTMATRSLQGNRGGDLVGQMRFRLARIAVPMFCAAMSVVATVSRPRGAVRIIDAILFVISQNVPVLAIMLHAFIVFVLCYALVSLLVRIFGKITANVLCLLIFGFYMYIYFTWGSPMVP